MSNSDICKKLRFEGKSIRLIAQETKLSYSTVRYHIKGTNVKATKTLSKTKPVRRQPIHKSVEQLPHPHIITNFENLLTKLFNRKVSHNKRKNAKCVDLRMWGNDLSDIINLDSGVKKEDILIPKWIFENHSYCRMYLKGLMETDGSIQRIVFSETHSSYQAFFTQKNETIMNSFLLAANKLGFDFSMDNKLVKSSRRVRISSKQNVLNLISILELEDKLRTYDYSSKGYFKKMVSQTEVPSALTT